MRCPSNGTSLEINGSTELCSNRSTETVMIVHEPSLGFFRAKKHRDQVSLARVNGFDDFGRTHLLNRAKARVDHADAFQARLFGVQLCSNGGRDPFCAPDQEYLEPTHRAVGRLEPPQKIASCDPPKNRDAENLGKPN